MALMEISIVPIGTGKTSVSEYIVDAVKVLEENGIKYHVSPMGTVAEGDISVLFDAARKMHESIFFASDVARVVTTIRIDDRRDKEHTIERKIKSLKEKVKYKK
jgi:uncharacterized protein (TIGR00106 family)